MWLAAPTRSLLKGWECCPQQAKQAMPIHRSVLQTSLLLPDLSLESSVGRPWNKHVLVVQSYLTLQPHGMWPTRLLCPWDSPGKNTEVGCHSLLQGIIPTQGSSPGLLHYTQMLYHMSHKGNKHQIRSVAQSCLTLCDPMNRSTPGLLVHHQLPEFTETHPSSQWCHPAISSSVVPFSSCLQSLPASESFPMSQLFSWGGQSTGVSAIASFLPKKSQGWSPSEWTG